MQEPAVRGARYGHTNLIAHEWRTLAASYTTVFGCELVPLIELQSWSGPDA